VARAAWECDSIPTDVCERIHAVKLPSGSRLPVGREIDAGERLELVRTTVADAAPAGARDVAILAALIATGMRRAELVGLRVADVRRSGRLVRYAVVADLASLFRSGLPRLRHDRRCAAWAESSASSGAPMQNFEAELAARPSLSKRERALLRGMRRALHASTDRTA
jgi:hypothetical protein